MSLNQALKYRMIIVQLCNISAECKYCNKTKSNLLY